MSFDISNFIKSKKIYNVKLYATCIIIFWQLLAQICLPKEF